MDASSVATDHCLWYSNSPRTYAAVFVWDRLQKFNICNNVPCLTSHGFITNNFECHEHELKVEITYSVKHERHLNMDYGIIKRRLQSCMLKFCNQLNSLDVEQLR